MSVYVTDECGTGQEQSIGCAGGMIDPVAEDTGSAEPLLPGFDEWSDVASLRDTLRRTRDRIERECGGKCSIDAMISSEAEGPGGFMVRLTVDGETAVGHGADLDSAELCARLEVSVKLAERRKMGKGVAAHV